MNFKFFILLFLLIIPFGFSASEQVLNRMVLKVNGKAITLFDLKKAMNPDNPDTVTYQAVVDRKTQLIERVTNDELVRQELELLKMDISNEEIERAAENVATQNSITISQLKEEIKSQGLSWEVYKNTILRKQLELLNLKRHITVTTVDIDESILKSMYDNQFKKENYYTASHIILLSVKDSSDDSSVFKNITDIHQKIISASVSFEDAAIKHSQDGSASSGGVLGTFAASQMVPEFSEKLVMMKEGEISKPFKTRFGWHIIKLSKVEKKDPPPYNEMRGRLLNVYYQQNMEKAFQNWLGKKKEESRIEILF
ncbi:MAG TPA: peptidylprolyl isomerase [bacterium]|nr:peptidylprolyl isomerase [bacterium]HPY15690.1 peptidylprolyl isomerase [bacterium]HQB09705.1 peptidylprolyl isomerase [bacterium]